MATYEIQGDRAANSAGTGPMAFPLGASITGVTDASSAASGFIGQCIELSQATPTTVGANTVFVQVGTQLVPAGDWDVSIAVQVSGVSASTFPGAQLVFTTTTASNAGGVIPVNYVQQDITSGSNQGHLVMTLNFRLNLSAATTYFLNLRTDYTGTAPTYVYYAKLRRAH